PNDNWTIDTTISSQRIRDDDLGGQCAPSTPWEHAFRYGDPGQVLTHAECEENRSYGAFVNSSDKRPFSHVDQEGVFVAAQWDSNGPVGSLDALRIKTTASYRSIWY